MDKHHMVSILIADGGARPEEAAALRRESEASLLNRRGVGWMYDFLCDCGTPGWEHDRRCPTCGVDNRQNRA